MGTTGSPVGTVRFAVEEGGAVVALGFDDRWAGLARHVDRASGGVTFAPARSADPVGAALDAYFAGDLAALDVLRVDPRGTPFQLRVWAALRAVPAGATGTYADIARAVGSPRAVRAVGAANGANPVSLILPCHRIIGSDGSLTGYGGGMHRKEWLLAHESRAHIPPSPKRQTPMPLHPFAGGGHSAEVKHS
ncbi:MAG TPA: methylated-DNA--[protein]-cysteine S-methyltransferase [Polyangiaceae bacterium]|nr:methylated-DNA--[protein]-cysteine S-methyltransferase [Polyangiaceae bacterium]